MSSSEQVWLQWWSPDITGGGAGPGGPTSDVWGEAGLGRSLYSEVKCIIGNGHMPPLGTERQSWMKTLLSFNFFSGSQYDHLGSHIFYRPQMKLREGNVFTGVCLQWVGMSPVMTANLFNDLFTLPGATWAPCRLLDLLLILILKISWFPAWQHVSHHAVYRSCQNVIARLQVKCATET